MKQNILVVAIASGALCFAIGFGGGALLTRPNREKTKATIAAVEAKANEAQTIAQQKIQAAKTETTRLQNELKRATAELKQAKNELKRLEAELKDAKSRIIAEEKEVSEDKVEERDENITTKPVDRIKIASKPMFGIYLGEKLSDVQKRFGVAKRGLTWVVQDTSTAVEDCHIDICKDRVWAITVWLKDNTERNFNILKRQLKKEYGKYQFREAKSSDYKYSKDYEFTITFDDIPVLITITFSNNALYDGLSEKDNELAIQYIHRPLMGKEK